MSCALFCISLLFLLNYEIECRFIQNSTDEENISTILQKLEDRIENLENIIQTGGVEDQEHVLFFVRLSQSTTLNKNSILKFDEAVINEGDHFNTGDGIFVAPVDGIYEFTWTTLTYNTKNAETELRVDNVVMATNHIYLTSGTSNIPATKVALCKVKEGDHVWIQTSRQYTEHFFYRANDARSSFTGLLIQKL